MQLQLRLQLSTLVHQFMSCPRRGLLQKPGAKTKRGLGEGPATEELETLWQARWRPLQRQRTAWCRRKVIIDEVLRLIESGLAPDDAVAELEAQRNKRSLQVLHDKLKAEQLSESLRAQLLSN